MQQPSNATSSADDAATNSSTPAAAGYSMGQFSAKDPLGKVKELDEETPPGVVISVSGLFLIIKKYLVRFY